MRQRGQSAGEERHSPSGNPSFGSGTNIPFSKLVISSSSKPTSLLILTETVSLLTRLASDGLTILKSQLVKVNDRSVEETACMVYVLVTNVWFLVSKENIIL